MDFQWIFGLKLQITHLRIKGSNCNNGRKKWIFSHGLAIDPTSMVPFLSENFCERKGSSNLSKGEMLGTLN